MKKSLIICLALFLLLWSPSILQAEFVKTKIGVLDFQLQGTGYETKDMGKIVAEWLVTALVKEGRFDVIERRLLEKILHEHELAMTGVVDENSATRLGKLLGVKVIISGSVLKLQKMIEVNARIIDVESASIMAAESVKSNAALQLEELIVQMAEKIIMDFPLEGYIVHRNRGKVVIDLGKRYGVKPNMRFMVFKEGNVIKHPKTGEVLDVERIRTGIIEVIIVKDKIADAIIVSENSAGAIEYGNRVKSTSGSFNLQSPMVTADPSSTVNGHLFENSPPSYAVSSRPNHSPKIRKILEMLKSSNYKTIRYGARLVFNKYPHNITLLDTINDRLLELYMIPSKKKINIDALAWLCNVLGKSGDVRYKSTLKNVAKKTRSKKLKKFARKNYRKLRARK